MDIKNKIEAILFLAGDFLDLKDLQDSFSLSKREVKKILTNMRDEKKNSGLNIEIKNNKVQLVTNPKYGKIIAYNQPVTKLDVDDIRGVNSDKTISTLQDKNLVYISGQKDTIGTPNIYKVTDDFLKYMNVEKISDLPKYNEVTNERRED
mgnify:CR=1 FL=1